MPDNWTFVVAAYGLAAAVFGGYWLRLGRQERDLAARTAGRATDRRRQPSRSAPPRSEPGSWPPLP